MGILKLSSRIYLDSTVFIDALDGVPEHAERLIACFAVFRAKPLRTVTSELTLAEVMGKVSPSIGWARQSRFFLDLIVWGRFIELRAVSRDILWETGDLRRATKLGGRSLGLADAIHIATAIKAGCNYVLSSDQRLLLPLPLQRLDPRNMTLDQIEQLLDA